MDARLGTVDSIVFAISLIISLGIGAFFAFKGHNNTNEYLLGGRDMPLIPTSLSILVSFLSGILFLGVSSEMYMNGTQYCWYLPGLLVGAVLSIFIFVPIFYRLKMTSVYEYLYLRFDSKFIRLLGSIFFILTTLVYMGIVLYAPSTALAAVTGASENVLIVCTGISCTVYTMLGGLKAVVWTDAFQAVIMYGGLMAITFQGLNRVGGISEAWSIAWDGGRITTDWTVNPFVYMNFWVVFFGTVFWIMSVFGTSQQSVQRYCSMSSLKRAKLSIILVVPGALLIVPLIFSCGLVMYSYYATCDPLMSKQISNIDQLILYFTIDILAQIKGMPGIFVSALFSATLSTVSSGLNSLAAVTWDEFIRVQFQRCVNIDETKATKITKALVILYGIVAMAFSYIAQCLGGVFQAMMTVVSVFGGPIAGTFLFGIMFPWGNSKGAISGQLGSTGIMMWICIGAQIYKPYRASLPRSISGCSNATLDELSHSLHLVGNSTNLPEPVKNPAINGVAYLYTLSYQLYALAAILLVFVIGIPVSLITIKTLVLSDNTKKLIWPGWCTLFKCLPASVREKYNLNEPREQSLDEANESGNFEIVEGLTKA